MELTQLVALLIANNAGGASPYSLHSEIEDVSDVVVVKTGEEE